jgi:hypothetical protein
MRKRLGHGGGTAAIGGYVVQTLVALLDLVQADPPFTAIVLEPLHAEEQFDVVWHGAKGNFAVQVKSSKSAFRLALVAEWADKLQAVRHKEQCKLILAGHFHASMEGVTVLDQVAIEQRSLDLPALYARAADLTGQFMRSQHLDAGGLAQHAMIAANLVIRLLQYATVRESFSHKAFVTMLKRWIKESPRQQRIVDIDAISPYIPKHLMGREAILKSLMHAWEQAVRGDARRPHLMSVIGLGGEGKTALVAKWAAQLAHQDWPGCEAVFAWSFCRQSNGGGNQIAASSDLFLSAALRFFGDPQTAASNQRAFDKGRRLAALVGAHRALLILDGVEPLQYAPSSVMQGRLKDQGLMALLQGLAVNSQGLCVLTTRYVIPDLHAFCENTSPDIALPRLTGAAGVALLHALGVVGGHKEFEQVVAAVGGHALSLNLMGSYLRTAHAGDICQGTLVKRSTRQPGRSAKKAVPGSRAMDVMDAFDVMDAYIRWFEQDGADGKQALALLQCMGLFDRPADAACLAALWQAPLIAGLTDALFVQAEKWLSLKSVYRPLETAQINRMLARLQYAQLLSVQRDSAGGLLSVDMHPLLREYFAGQVRDAKPAAWQAAHRRLYEYLSESTIDQAAPTLEALQPLYQAVAHGCLADMQQAACDDVYKARIVRETQFYSVHQLGAFGADLGAVACFFTQAWQRVSPALGASAQAWLLTVAAFNLRALGRLREAIAPMRSVLAMRVRQKNWCEAAIAASHLSELQMTLGELDGALGDAKQSVRYADRCGDVFQRLSKRTSYGDVLHQAGSRDTAAACFGEAEAMQAESQPDYPLLYAKQGFQYCDLLLTAAERRAWQRIFECMGGPSRAVPDDRAQQMQSCNAVARRAAQTLQWVLEQNWTLDLALDNLTLGRAALFAGILEDACLDPCHAAIQEAVTGLRRAGQSDYLARGLLTRAWLRVITGNYTGAASAQTDLDEAWDIAVHGPMGPMPLHMADIHLYRARLFCDHQPYPWRSPTFDLAQARRLIVKHGYLRRMAELEDAERAIGLP